MTAPYRTPGECPPDPPAPKRKARLIKAKPQPPEPCCKPPGQTWCWWHNVEPEDVWECMHGVRWKRGPINVLWFVEAEHGRASRLELIAEETKP